MSDQVKFDVHINSPRWGLINIYEFHLDQEHMTIGKKADPNPSICTWNEWGKPLWSTQSELEGGNPFVSALEIELIHPPTIFVRSLETAWKAWRNGFLDDEQVQHEIGVLCEWVNLISFMRPRTDFWRRTF